MKKKTPAPAGRSGGNLSIDSYSLMGDPCRLLATRRTRKHRGNLATLNRDSRQYGVASLPTQSAETDAQQRHGDGQPTKPSPPATRGRAQCPTMAKNRGALPARYRARAPIGDAGDCSAQGIVEDAGFEMSNVEIRSVSLFKRRAGRLSRKRARTMIPSLQRRLKILCSAKLTHPKTRNLCDRLLSPKRDAKKLFTFLKRPGMPPTNNHAERALRGPVISRKISFGSRSETGAHAFAVLASLLGTARRQNQHVLKFLQTLFTGNIDAAQTALYKNTA